MSLYKHLSLADDGDSLWAFSLADICLRHLWWWLWLLL